MPHFATTQERVRRQNSTSFNPIADCVLRKKRESENDDLLEIPPIVGDVLKSPGQPLDADTRAFMEPRFGYDFGHVRVHTDAKAADSAHVVHAHAYTLGQDVVFGTNEFAPATHQGRELLAHELAHTIQQRNASGPHGSADSHPVFESSASAAARSVTSGEAVSRDFPRCGLQIQRAPDKDPRWKNDPRAARYRGQLMANRIKKHGKLSREARAKINEELAYFEGDAKEAYLREVRPVLQATVEIQMPEERVIKKIPRPPPVTWSLAQPDPRRISDEEIYAPLIEAKHKEEEAEEAERQGELEKLREMTKKWGSDQEFAVALLEPILKANLHPDPRGVAAAIRTSILARYEIWLRETDKRRLAACEKMPGGVVGFIMRRQADWHPTLNPCRSWFKDQYSHGPQELMDLERKLKIRGTSGDAMHTVYWSMFEYRLKTDPLMLQQEQMASEMVSGLAGLGGVPGKPGVVEPATVPPAAATAIATERSAVAQTIKASPPPPPARPPAQTIKASPPPPPVTTRVPPKPGGPVAVTDAEVVAANVLNPSSIKPAASHEHEGTWQGLGGSGNAPATFRDQEGNIHIRNDHWLLAPASRAGIPPVRPSGGTPVPPQPAPVPSAAPPQPDIASVKTGTPPSSPAVADPLAKTPSAPAPPPAVKQPAPPSPKVSPQAQTGEAAAESRRPQAPVRRNIDPPQAVSEDVVRRMQAQPRPSPPGVKGRGSSVNYTVDHDHHVLAWQRLGGRGDAPPAFIYDGQVYLDPSRWPRNP